MSGTSVLAEMSNWNRLPVRFTPLSSATSSSRAIPSPGRPRRLSGPRPSGVDRPADVVGRDIPEQPQLGQYDVTVNDVCPNVTNGARMDRIVAEKARLLGKTPEEVYADFAAQTALGRFVEESDVANPVRFLVSPSARNITGHDFPVDAGWDV